MAAEAASTIAQLEAARQVVLSDAAHYSVVIPGVTPIIGQNALVDVRIWGASFIAESFASPILSQQQKETLGVQTLPLMHELLEAPGQNEAVVKSIIQAMASVYAPVFKNVYVPSTYVL
jgi:symplekin